MRKQLIVALAIALIGGGSAPAYADLATDRKSDQPIQTQAQTVSVDADTVVQSDYLGVGLNIIPWSLMPGTTTLGYDEADWQIDAERIASLRPKVVRMWFQVDWMEPTKGHYDFNTPKMQAFYRYLDALKAAGTEVELDFGWKVGKQIQDWFSIPGVADPSISAPADVNAFGASASALLSNLFDRGYRCVKYLTFYNEPNGSWDFEAPGDQQEYYATMARAVSDRLRTDGLRDQIQIWGPEEVSAPEWTSHMAQSAGDVFDAYSFHLYGESYDAMSSAIAQRRSVIGGKPLNLTEMGWASPGMSGWETGYANYIIGSANSGVHSNLIWQMNGVMTDDPAGDTNGSYNLWDSVILGLNPTKAFYEAGPLVRYIPGHSQVLASHSDATDLRTAAFRAADGNYTVVVETKAADTPRNVTIGFGDAAIPRQFHRIDYRADAVSPEPNALLPAATTVRAHRNRITDRVPAGYGYTIYTSAPAETQVALDPVDAQVNAGESLRLTASVVNGSPRLDWSVLGSGNGTIDSTGRYTAPILDAERDVAIKASNRDTGQAGIARVHVQPRTPPGSAAAPRFSLSPGVHESAEAITITTDTPGASVHYTTDGSTPSASSPLYTGPVFLNSGTVYLRAMATAPGLADSSVTSRLYKILDVQNAPDGYSFCAYEGGRCEFSGRQSVVFGAGRQFVYGTFTDGATCDAAHFPDAPDVADRRCFVSPTIPDPPPAVTVFNAGFEKPATTSAANGPMVNGWTFAARAGVQSNTSAFVPAAPAPEGAQTAYLKTDSGLSSRIDQDLLFPAGTFTVSFMAANRVGFGGQQRFNVEIDGQVIATVAPASGEYVRYQSDPFDLDAGTHRLSFVATTTEGDNTAFIDQVVIQAS